jgi:hypothetical protein
LAIVVLVLWLFTAGAGFSVLISSNLKRDHAAPSAQLAPTIARTAARPAPAPQAASRSDPEPVSRREAKRARREQFDPPSLVAARSAPVIPGAQALLEFAHPACGIIGLAAWLGFSLVHARLLGWMGFGLATVTACAGLTWFALNVRTARRAQNAPGKEPPPGPPAPSFHGRLVALHGAAAAVTLVLVALTLLVLHG